MGRWNDGTLLVTRGYVTRCLYGPSQRTGQMTTGQTTVLMEIVVNH